MVQVCLTANGLSIPFLDLIAATEVELRWCKSILSISTMKQQRNQKAKSLGATRQEVQSVKKELRDQETHMLKIRKCDGPPPLRAAPVLSCVRRFINNANTLTNQVFSLANGHDQFLTVVSTLGLAVSYADSWRLKMIKVYLAGNSNLGTVTNTSFALSPVSTDLSSNMFNDKEAIYQIQSSSASETRCLKIKCGERTPLGGWHFTNGTNSAGNLFQMNAVSSSPSIGQNITMDLTFDYVPNLAGLPLGYSVTTATTTVGTIGGRNIPGFALRGINQLG